MSVLILIFGFVMVMTIHQTRVRERRDKLRLLEEAIRSGHVDAATKQQLLAELTDRRGTETRAHHGMFARLAFAIGWIGLFLGVGLLTVPERDAAGLGWFVLASGFALITLPIAMREFDRDRERVAGASPRSPRS